MTNRTKAIVSLGGVFLLGAVCGALTLGLVVQSRVREAQNLRDRQGFEEYFADRLRLTEAQRDSLKGELDRTYDELTGLRRSAADEYHELLDTFAYRLAPKLSPEQRELLRREEQRFRTALPKERPLPPSPRTETSRKEEPAPSTPPVVVQHSAVDSGRKLSSQQQHPQTSAVVKSDTGQHKPLTAASPPDSSAAGEVFQPEQLAKTYRERLNLTDDQSRQVREIVQQTHQRIKRAKEELNGFPGMLGAAIRRNLREMDFKIADILTQDQMPAYRELREELKEKLKSHIEKLREQKRELRRDNGNNK